MKHLEKRLRALEQRRRPSLPLWQQIQRLSPEEYAEFLRPANERWRDEFIAGGRWTPAREARYQQLRAETRIHGHRMLKEWQWFMAETWLDELEADDPTGSAGRHPGAGTQYQPMPSRASGGEAWQDTGAEDRPTCEPEEEDEPGRRLRRRSGTAAAGGHRYVTGGEASQLLHYRDDRYTRRN